MLLDNDKFHNIGQTDFFELNFSIGASVRPLLYRDAVKFVEILPGHLTFPLQNI
jgi:hypothetical protein